MGFRSGFETRGLSAENLQIVAVWPLILRIPQVRLSREVADANPAPSQMRIRSSSRCESRPHLDAIPAPILMGTPPHPDASPAPIQNRTLPLF
jgi:hypothetical protein